MLKQSLDADLMSQDLVPMVQMCHVVHGIKASCMLAPEEPNPTSSQCTGSCLKQTLASRTGASGILSEARLYDKLPSQQAESEAQFTASSGHLLQIFGVDATCEDDVKPWVTSRSTQHTISERERESHFGSSAAPLWRGLFRLSASGGRGVNQRL